ncbi:hypothetical protein ACLOJK_011976 [Asimina triloba]
MADLAFHAKGAGKPDTNSSFQNGFLPSCREKTWERKRKLTRLESCIYSKAKRNQITKQNADDGFLKFGGVKPPDLADWRSDATASDCEQTCLSKAVVLFDGHPHNGAVQQYCLKFQRRRQAGIFPPYANCHPIQSDWE